MILTKKLVDILSNKNTLRLERAKLPLFLRHEGIVRVASPPALGPKINGNILIDPSMTSPIQIINWESDPVGPKYITETIHKALQARKDRALPVNNLHAAFRLVNGLGDGLPGICIDIYGTYAMIHMYSQHWDYLVKDIAKTLTHLDRRVDGVYLVDRTRKGAAPDDESSEEGMSRFKSTCVWGKKAPEHKTIVQENGLLYHVQLDNGPAIGLYMDQRLNRTKVVDLLKKVQAQANDTEERKQHPRFLNTFSFSGSFSVAAAKNANAKTTNVDASELANTWARDNFILNGIDLDQSAHEFVKKDAFSALSSYFAQSRAFDVVLLDPPTVSRVKVKNTTSQKSALHPSYVPSLTAQSKTIFSSLDNYSDLVALASPLVAPGGYLVCFVNTHSLDKEKWRNSIELGLSSIIPKMKEHLDTERANSVRSYLRKRGVKVKYRNSILDRQKDLKLSEDIIRNHYGFSFVDEWLQDTSDFTVREGDAMGYYLHGIVLKRNLAETPLPPVVMPTISRDQLHDSKKSQVSQADSSSTGLPVPRNKTQRAQATKKKK